MDLGEVISTDVDLGLLTAPFPRTAIKSRTVGGGRSLSYVEGHTVIHRLNAATGNCWDMQVVAIESMAIGNQTVLRAHVRLSIPGLGTREHVGVQSIADRAGEDLVKGAVTDALKKCATLFGVGLELYGPDYGSGEIESEPEPKTPAKAKDKTAALVEVASARGLDAKRLGWVAQAVVGNGDIDSLDREDAATLWQFLKKASVRDMDHAIDAGQRESVGDKS